MRMDTRLLFVGVLVVIFPLIFLYITQSFFDTAYTNIQTAEKRRVGMMHDSLAALLEINPATNLNPLIATQVANNPDITEVRVVKSSPDGLQVQTSLDQALVGSYEASVELYELALGNSKNSLIVESIIDGERVWRVVRSVKAADGVQYYILSEHSFELIDSVMAARRQQSYLGLTAIFLFLMGLAYWVSRQKDWQRKHDEVTGQLQQRDLFTTMIAHEFRSPLTVINGYSSFLAESKSITGEEARYVSTIQTSVGRLLALVNDFLEVARIQSGKLSVASQNIDVQTVLTSVVDSLRLSAKEKHLKLTFEPTKNPITLATDPKRLAQVIQNLVTNAIKYTDEGTVTLACEETSRTVTIRIKDSGTGISAEDQQKLFAPFSRVGGVENSTITGTGLGMWITKQLVDLLGGTISVESIKNVGTHVVIVFKH